MKSKLYDWTNEKLHENMDMVEGHVDSSVDRLSKTIKVPITDEIQKEMETFVVKTIQKMEIGNEISLRMLKSSFKKLSLKHKISIYMIEPKRWLKKIFRGR